jgi:signal transduction histidine kinase/CheY-like chemotaxis protein
MIDKKCPVTGLPIESRPEWTDLQVAEQYCVTFKRIGDNILLNLPQGNMAYFDTDRYFELRNKVICEAFPDGRYYVDLKSYEKLTGSPLFRERKKLIRKLFDEAATCKGYLIYGQSSLVTMIFNVATEMLGKLPFPARTFNDYESAVLFADGLLKKEQTEQNELQKHGFITKIEWNYKNPVSGCVTDFMVSNDNILFTRFSGKGNVEDLIHVEDILEKIISGGFVTNGYTKITEFRNFSLGSIDIRKGYADLLNRVHKKYKVLSSKSYVCNSNPLIKILILFESPNVNIPLTFVRTPGEALSDIKATTSQNKKTEQKYTITDTEINALTSMVSQVALDLDSEREIFTHDNPLKQIETALNLVKKDRQITFSEIESKNNDLKVAIEELKKARDSAEKATLAKGRFLSNMSHELRTPLNGVIGSTELLKETCLDEEQQAFLSIIYKSSVHLLAVINDILDYSKMESGQIKLEELPFEYGALIEDVVSIVYSQTLEKRISVIVDIDYSMKKILKGDPFRLRQVVLNLLQNAIKFTSQGHILIETKVISEDEQYQRVKLSVIDTGIGIEQNVIPQLFNQFVQADSSTTRKFGGTGLGLAIVKQLTELMRGMVIVESTPGKGSTFSIEIPFKKTENDEPFLSTERKISGNIVLLVNDSCEREWYEKTFCVLGGTVVYSRSWFENGKEKNIQKILSEKNALCVIDSGFESANLDLLFFNCTHVKTRFIYIKNSHEGNNNPEKKCLEGVTVCNKPIKISNLQTVMERCFLNDNLQISSKKDDSEGVIKEKHTSRILLVEDSPTNQIVAKKLLEKIGYWDITTCNNGKEALHVLENQIYDLIFMDCQMPEIDGFRATEIIRDKNSTIKDHGVFIIAFTAHAMQEEIQKCLLVGMNDYVLKPVTLDSLKSVLSRWMNSRKSKD